MLKGDTANEVVAICEDCDETSSPIVGSRALAVLRLMRMRWRVRTESSVTRTWCPACQPLQSIPAMRLR